MVLRQWLATVDGCSCNDGRITGRREERERERERKREGGKG